jgi:hypothetical protein
MVTIENKKNPKGPDFRCSDPDCKYEYDKESREYVPSEYRTACWLPKEKGFTKEIRATLPNPIQKTNGQTHPEMLMAFAKDVVVALIMTNNAPPAPFKEIIAGYRDLLQELKNPNSVDIL